MKQKIVQNLEFSAGSRKVTMTSALFSAFLVYEGSRELGPVAICRVVDPEITRAVGAAALNKTMQMAEAMRIVDADAFSDACDEADRIRAVMAAI